MHALFDNILKRDQEGEKNGTRSLILFHKTTAMIMLAI